MVANRGAGDRPQGYQKDRPKLQERTQADKAPIRKAEDHKKSLSNLRQQAEPASKGTVKLRSHAGDRPHGNPKDRTKLADKTQAEKAPSGNAQKAEDHKKSISNLRQQTHPASKATANSRS
jgi:hypothetical protein